MITNTAKYRSMSVNLDNLRRAQLAMMKLLDRFRCRSISRAAAAAFADVLRQQQGNQEQMSSAAQHSGLLAINGSNRDADALESVSAETGDGGVADVGSIASTASRGDGGQSGGEGEGGGAEELVRTLGRKHSSAERHFTLLGQLTSSGKQRRDSLGSDAGAAVGAENKDDGNSCAEDYLVGRVKTKDEQGVEGEGEEGVAGCGDGGGDSIGSPFDASSLGSASSPGKRSVKFGRVESSDDCRADSGMRESQPVISGSTSKEAHSTSDASNDHSSVSNNSGCGGGGGGGEGVRDRDGDLQPHASSPTAGRARGDSSGARSSTLSATSDGGDSEASRDLGISKLSFTSTGSDRISSPALHTTCGDDFSEEADVSAMQLRLAGGDLSVAAQALACREDGETEQAVIEFAFQSMLPQDLLLPEEYDHTSCMDCSCVSEMANECCMSLAASKIRGKESAEHLLRLLGYRDRVRADAEQLEAMDWGGAHAQTH